jgi:hypothetical protein
MTDIDTATTEGQEKAHRAAAGLRELADLLEANPEWAEGIEGEYLRACVGDWRPDAAETFARMAKALGGNRVKTADDNWFNIQRRFGPITVELYTQRETVCTKKVVGTRTVEKPDPNAPKVRVEEDVVEWECNPLFAEAAGE